MGGQGPGHRSVRAIEARLKNIQKARAGRKRAPLPWRSAMESRIIEQLVWQWWVESSGEWLVVSGEKNKQQISRSSGQWLVASGEKKQKQVPHRHPAKPAGWVRDDKFGSPWAKYRVARFLGVSHTWVNKLVKRIEADPERMRRKMRAFAPASFEKLERAREETRRERERGLLRGPIRWRRVKLSLQGRKRKVMVPTKRNKQQIPDTAGMRSVPFDCAQDKRNDNIPLPYREVPEWARGLLLPGDPGITGRVGGRRTPRPVPFAFRRRR